MRIPLDYLDKLCLAGTSREHGISSAPVWQLLIEGHFDEDVARRAMKLLVRRYPILVSRVVADGANRPISQERALYYEVDSAPNWEALFWVEDLSGVSEEEFVDFRQRFFNHHIDMATDYPARFCWAKRGKERGVLFLQQHHSIADGKAFFALIRDFCQLYDASIETADEGEAEQALALEPILKLSEEVVAEAHPWKRRFFRMLGFFRHLGGLIKVLFASPDQLYSNRGLDYSGNNNVYHLYLDEGILEDLRALRASTGYSVNDFLSTAIALALYRWSLEKGIEVHHFNLLIPADARPRGKEIRSFANHLSSFLVDLYPERLADNKAWIAEVSRQIRFQAKHRIHLKKLLSEILVARLFTLGQLRDVVFKSEKTLINFPFSNLIPISPRENGGRFLTRHWVAERLEIMTPCGYLQGANTTVIHYNGSLCFNFNYKESIVSREEIERFASLFREILLELMGEFSPTE